MGSTRQEHPVGSASSNEGLHLRNTLSDCPHGKDDETPPERSRLVPSGGNAADETSCPEDTRERRDLGRRVSDVDASKHSRPGRQGDSATYKEYAYRSMGDPWSTRDDSDEQHTGGNGLDGVAYSGSSEQASCQH